MTATINTDASYEEASKLGGYAFWIVIGGKRYMKSGLLKGEIQDSIEAELKSIANALHYLVYVIRPEKLNVIYLNTDSKSSIDFIQSGKVSSKKGKYTAELKRISSAIKDLTLEFRHVPAHKKVDTKRGWVNHWCDKESRQAIYNHKLKQHNIQNGTFGDKIQQTWLRLPTGREK